MAEKVEEKVDEKKDETPLTEEGLMKGITQIADLVKSLKEKTDETDDETDTFAKGAADASDEIRKGIEVSNFLEDLVNEVGDSIDKLNKSQGEGAGAIKKSITDMGEIMKSTMETMKASFDALGERMKALETTPVGGRKSVLVKGEERFTEGGDEDSAKISKAQIVDKLLILKSAGKATTLDIASFETTGKLKKSLRDEIFPVKEVQ
jgi:DNA-binding ferritin-like protein